MIFLSALLLLGAAQFIKADQITPRYNSGIYHAISYFCFYKLK
jgi:hypothetical protein